jgi:putative aldouronate transport system permease protein
MEGKGGNRMIKAIAHPESKVRKKSLYQQFLQYRPLLAMLMIPIIYITIFAYIPMSGIVLAFKNYNYSDGMWGSPWIGLQNFNFFFISGAASRVIRNTLLYNLAFIIVGTTVQVFFAIILNEVMGRIFKKITQSLMLLPFFISWVVASSIVYNILHYEFGLLNGILTAIGLEPINVYVMPQVWPFLLIFFNLWKGAGYGTIIYLANITSIDPQLFEAAEIDGANVWQRIRHITLPHLKPTVIILFLLAMGSMFRGDFGMFFQLIGNNGLLLPYTDIIDTYVFRMLIGMSDVGMSAASGLFQSVMCFVTVMTANFVVKKIEPDYALF